MRDDILDAVRSIHRAYASISAMERHLKRAEGKGDRSSIPGVDLIYLINLDARPEKYAVARRFFEVYGVTPYRFPAINGWELSRNAVQDVGLKFRQGMAPLLATTYPTDTDEPIQVHEIMSEVGRTYFAHGMPLGAIGCSLSHISVLQDAYDSGYETIWVVEDDVEMFDDPRRLSDVIEELDALVGADKWDVLFTNVDRGIGAGQDLVAPGVTMRPDVDPDEHSSENVPPAPVNAHLRRLAARRGTTSTVIRRSGIKKLLTFFKTRQIFHPYDLDSQLPPGIRRYELTFDLATNMPDAVSDIETPPASNASVTIGSILQKHPEPVYQDLVAGGRIYHVGTEICDGRYELLRPVLDLQGGRFSVLDLGAAQGYFSFRIAQDYPQSTCLMVDADAAPGSVHHGSILRDLSQLNAHLPNVTFLEQRMDRLALSRPGGIRHFDVVLALLVVPLMDERLKEQIEILKALLNLGDHLILEVASDIDALHTAYVEYLSDALDAQVLGTVRRHKDLHSTATARLLWFARARS